MIVSITGGNGFIGKTLKKCHLKKGDSVRVLTRSLKSYPETQGKAVTFFCGDLIQGTGELQNFVRGADILYHCAGEIQDTAKMLPLHVNGTKHLITCAQGKIGHWVQLGSVGSYGPRKTGIVTEATPPSPIGSYETTKTISDNLVKDAAHKGAFSCTILRPSNVYGPAMPNQSIFQLISTIHRKIFFFIGPPGASANYIHVNNVVDALMLCGHKQATETSIFNLSDHRTLEELVSIIARLLGVAVPTMRLPVLFARLIALSLGQIPKFPLNQSRVNALTNKTIYLTDHIQKTLHYTLGVSMEDGLSQMVTTWRAKTSGTTEEHKNS